MDIGVNFVGFVLAVCLSLVHVLASRTQWVQRVPQSWWVSIAGGVSIAYIFLDIPGNKHFFKLRCYFQQALHQYDSNVSCAPIYFGR